MGKEIKFPARAVRNWEEVRPGIEEALRDAGLPLEGVGHIMERARSAWLEYDQDYRIEFDLPLPPTTTPQQREEAVGAVREAIGQLERRFQSMLHQMFLDRIRLEVELYIARND